MSRKSALDQYVCERKKRGGFGLFLSMAKQRAYRMKRNCTTLANETVV